MTLNFLHVLTILSLLALSRSALILSNTPSSLKVYSSNQNYVTEYSLNAHIPSLVLLNGYVEVEFPFLFEIPSTCTVYIKTPKALVTKPKCEKISGMKYLIQIGKIIPGSYQLIFEHIRNPALDKSSDFKIRTYVNKHTLVDSNEAFGSVTFLPFPSK